MTTVHPYGKYFFMTNKDPYNYVLNRDFFFYIIVSIYVMFFWVIASVYENMDYLNDANDVGQVITVLNNIITALTGFLILVSVFNPNNPHVYPLGGIIFILFLIMLGLIIFTFDRREVSPFFENDIVSLSMTFLLLYSFVSYYIC
jgi:uncharacterized protein YacL